MTKAFNTFYGEIPSADTGKTDLLLGELERAKQIFAECIESFPESAWTNDAIDRVFSINKWLY